MSVQKWYHSSAGDGSLALSVKAGIPAVAAAVVVVARMAGVDVAETEVAQVLEAILTVISVSMFLVGVARKVIVALKKRFGK